jgi:uncharacterized protein (TIGR03382 family)
MRPLLHPEHRVVALRVVTWLLTGVVWAGSSLFRVVASPTYWAPATPIEWVAVAAWSAGLTLLAASLLLAVGAVALRGPTAAIVHLTAAGAATAAVANLLEHGARVPAFGVVYAAGILVAWLGLAALAVLFARRRRWDAAVAFALMFAGVALSTLGGGVLVLAGWATMAVTHRGRRLPLPVRRG